MRVTLGAIALSLIVANAAFAESVRQPPAAVPGFGQVTLTPEMANPDPKLDYRVVFDVTRGGDDAAAPNPGLERVARFANYLSAARVPLEARNLVAVVHGAATKAILTDAAYQAKYGRPNPTTPLLAALRAAGVDVHVCSVVLSRAGITPDMVSSSVTIDAAAMVTEATLQLKGWALVPG
ncbi:DsrE family protein [Phenylobacterium koreense]|uniref:Intracellular sulfur oxidation DsrE/DsrF family protein n=1 Tax=Phenylobacterium koreense TaxID=266125 RepID=A0ABV2ELX1_9CAUL